MVFDTSATCPGRDRRQAQWDLAVYGNEMGPVFTLPSFAIETDETLRPTEAGMRLRARTEAAALLEMGRWNGTGTVHGSFWPNGRMHSSSGVPFRCPVRH